jgi:hypothetical protein
MRGCPSNLYGHKVEELEARQFRDSKDIWRLQEESQVGVE